jgi:hypothetical protein
MSVAVSRRLPHFRAAVTPPVARPSGGFRPLVEAPDPEVPQHAPSEREQAIAAALAGAEARFEAARSADQSEFERRLAENERQILETVADRLAGQLLAALAALEQSVAGHTSRILLRFLDGSVRERALGELSETVAALIAGGPATKVKLTAPAALVERLRTRLPATLVEPIAGEIADVTVSIDDTIVETRISEWLERLLAAAGGTADG